ncbi:hypothetical protein FRZ06_10165 [Anoxybacterium hadale]|uniref:Uncharacterized protein n=1 Tax=Anoxybacterium hadale TaxID=3408580 RepID=A0ACD1ABP7_9FIRM|nr:hypothetical protein FRZ06_10165 [Clostridiales bacterium]
MMNSGALNQKIKVLALSRTDNAYQWICIDSIWAKAEPCFDRKSFQSRRMVKPVKFITRKNGITMSHAILWEDEHCFIINITEIDRMYQEITAVVIEPKLCKVIKTEVHLDAFNRPVLSGVKEISFPGSIVDLPSKRETAKPMSRLELRYLLTVPKEIELQAGELISIGNTDYEVWIPRLSFSDKNQYEIRVRRDV